MPSCSIGSAKRSATQGGSEPVLSQQVLLSLLQQLGYDLSREPVTKLNWIKDTAVALDPQVPMQTSEQVACLNMLARTVMPCLYAVHDLYNHALFLTC